MDKIKEESDDFVKVSCTHCGKDYFSLNFGPKYMLICSCCKIGSHVRCVQSENKVKIDDSILGHSSHWYCSGKCEKISKILIELDSERIPIPRDVNFSVQVVKYSKDRRIQSSIASALNILKNSFRPLTLDDGSDLLEGICKSKNGILDFSNFRVVILRKNKVSVSAATLRIFGTKFAEMPFIATRLSNTFDMCVYVVQEFPDVLSWNLMIVDHRKGGNCRRLVKAIVAILKKLGVEKIIVPSVNSVSDMWKSHFGLVEMNEIEISEIEDKIICPDLSTSMLLKLDIVSRTHEFEAKEPQLMIPKEEKIERDPRGDDFSSPAVIQAQEKRQRTGKTHLSGPEAQRKGQMKDQPYIPIPEACNKAKIMKNHKLQDPEAHPCTLVSDVLAKWREDDLGNMMSDFNGISFTAMLNSLGPIVPSVQTQEIYSLKRQIKELKGIKCHKT